MSTVLERLTKVREAMKEVERRLDSQSRIFDVERVNRRVRERLERVGIDGAALRSASER